MYFRGGKTKKCSVFHVENGEIQSMLWFYVCFNVEIHVIWLKTNFSTIYVRFLWNYKVFMLKKC